MAEASAGPSIRFKQKGLYLFRTEAGPAGCAGLGRTSGQRRLNPERFDRMAY